jgi:NDP-sugar pyrophosphorylase family protein
MQIIIPMSGFGERFRKVGYTLPKPLINIDGKPIIQYVVEMFPGEDDITFICNRDHLNEPEYRLQEILEEIAPECKIISISPHKLGPVHAVLEAIDGIDLDKPTIVNYADFTCDWDYFDFCNTVEQTQCDGAIPCYRGFHPHTLWSNYYAYVQEKDMRAWNIQEKQPFTDSPREEFASSGTYYFRNARVMQYYFERCVAEKLTVGGEYYVSMVYKPMMQDDLNIQVYELEHFMQWGTPTDLEEFQYWSNIFNSILIEKDPPQHKGSLLLPMVGLGTRFNNEGYELPKPLIEVSGKPMAVQAFMDLPKTEKQQFILRSNMKGVKKLKNALNKSSNSAQFSILDHMTDGQASTCVEGSSNLPIDEPVTIAACDNGMIYDPNLFSLLMDTEDIDVIIWAAKGYPGAIRNPEMYGWIDSEESGLVKNISVKKPLNKPSRDLIIVGAFTFKKHSNFIRSVAELKKRGGMVNGEYYIDSAINDAISLGLKCVVFEIDYYICWGTPNDLRTFEYWQSCFDGWSSHPYQIKKDRNVLNKIQ